MSKTRKKPVSISKKNKLNSIFKIIAALFVWGLLIGGVVLAWYAYQLPDIQNLKVKPRQPSIIFLTSSHQEIAVQGDVRGEAVNSKTVPKALIQALLATEDRHFYNHWGVDIKGMIRALFINIVQGRYVQGGSTLTQQLAKNLFLSSDRSIERKIKEMILAWKLEYYFSKEEILNIYLNRVYLGHKTYGVDAAAQQYFGKLVNYLNPAQCAVIVGLLKAPSRISRTDESLKSRGRIVLHNMYEAGYLNKDQYKVQLKKLEGLHFYKNPFGNDHRYFTDWIHSEAEKLVDCNQDLIIVTTINLPLQNKATRLLRQMVDQSRENYNVHQAAFVAMAYDGAVQVMIGGYNYNTSQFNVAFQAYRQPGSTFKALVFWAALEAGIDMQDAVSDLPYHNKKWTVNNFGWKTQGTTTLEKTLVHSINTATVRLAQRVGVRPIVNLAERLGFRFIPEANLSIALGTSQVNVLEMVAMMAVVANGGKIVKPYGILEIKTADGELLYKRDQSLQEAEQVRDFDVEVITKMDALLEKVVVEGTGKNAFIPGVRVCGKTGTSQNFRDAWFIGYTPDLVAGVWMGNFDERPMNRVSGSNLPAKLWNQILRPN